jgi:hypothetical protein
MGALPFGRRERSVIDARPKVVIDDAVTVRLRTEKVEIIRSRFAAVICRNDPPSSAHNVRFGLFATELVGLFRRRSRLRFLLRPARVISHATLQVDEILVELFQRKA